MKKENTIRKKQGRREFFGKASTSVFAAITLSTGNYSKAANTNSESFSEDFSPTALASEKNLKLQMQEDVIRTLKKPVDERKWGMAIDLRKCIGCNACTVACISENVLPPGIVYRPVLKDEIGTYPNVSQRNTPKPCMQCEEPPCVKVCPIGATTKRPDGIISMNYKKCMGCRYCMTACPYEHRVFDFGLYYTKDTPVQQEYEKRPSFEYGKEWKREKHKSPIGNVRKCTFCLHRIEEGLLPACITTCIGGANYFGDLNDPDSVISKLVAKPNVTVLNEKMGTQPKVFYIQ